MHPPTVIHALNELIRTRAAVPKLTPYIPHTPTPKQQAFLLLNATEAFYGGAAGGGKSDALLMAALQYVDIPGYSALLLRRTYTDLSLPGALMDRSLEWLRPTDASFDSVNKTWHFPSGATLTFGYLDHEDAKYRYKSAEFQFIGFDEVTEFTETQYRYLFSRLRRPVGIDVPLRMRAAGNPDGPGFEWVRRHFIVEGRHNGVVFIPATLKDNPHIDRESYVRSLEHLDPVTREKLLNGDWSVRIPGNLFRRDWFRIVREVPYNSRLVRYWDLAATEPKKGGDPDWTRGCLMARSPTGQFFVCDMVGARTTPKGVEDLILRTAQRDGSRVEIVIEQEPGSAGVIVADHLITRVLVGFHVRANRETGDKELRARPFSSQCEAGNVFLLEGAWIGDFLDELEAFPNGTHDDQVDAASGAFNVLAAARTAHAPRVAEKKSHDFSALIPRPPIVR